MSKPVKWLKRPKKKNYPAAEAYLALTLGQERARRLIKRLHKAKVKELPARDILRASRTPMAEVRAFDWDGKNKDIKKGRRLSPLLLVCNRSSDVLIVADGFHRLCAVFAQDQDAKVRFKIA